MSDLLSLAKAVLARKREGGAVVSSLHGLGNETLKQAPGIKPQGVETGDETPTKQRNSAAFEASDDGDEAERAAIIEFDGGIPRDWAEGVAHLISSPPPAGVSSILWRSRIDRAARFCDAWAAKAAACGWSAADLFGLNPAGPLARYDGMGAAFLGIAGEVVEVTPDAVVIQLANGVRQSISKRPDPQPPAWTMVR
jgi:hypothetical protein